MNNHIMLVGAVAENVVVQKTKTGKDMAHLVIEVPKIGGFKSTDTGVDKDVFKITLWGNAVKSMVDAAAKVGSVVAVDGRLSTYVYTKQDGTEGMSQQIEADDVTVISKEAVLYQGVNIVRLSGEVTQAISTTENDKGKSTGQLSITVPRFYKVQDDVVKAVSDELIIPLKGKQLDSALSSVFTGMMVSVDGRLNGSSYYAKTHDKLYNVSVWVREIIPFEINDLLDQTVHNKAEATR